MLLRHVSVPAAHEADPAPTAQCLYEHGVYTSVVVVSADVLPARRTADLDAALRRLLPPDAALLPGTPLVVCVHAATLSDVDALRRQRLVIDRAHTLTAAEHDQWQRAAARSADVVGCVDLPCAHGGDWALARLLERRARPAAVVLAELHAAKRPDVRPLPGMTTEQWVTRVWPSAADMGATAHLVARGRDVHDSRRGRLRAWVRAGGRGGVEWLPLGRLPARACDLLVLDSADAGAHMTPAEWVALMAYAVGERTTVMVFGAQDMPLAPWRLTQSKT